MSVTTTVHVPPGPKLPKAIQGAWFLLDQRGFMEGLGRRYGTAFTINVPFYRRAVVISDPVWAKQLYLAPADTVGNSEPSLELVLGTGSIFGLTGAAHRRRRKLLVPPFHGKRMRAYEDLIEQETLTEIGAWPQGREFAVMPSTMRITLNIILRAVFGAEGAELDELRALMPPMVESGSRLALMPWLHHDLGRFSPWGRYQRMRRAYDTVVGRLIDRIEADPHLDDRDDVLSLMLRARYDDGSAMSRGDLADELLTLIAAGHETTATTLAWAIERLRRHPDVLQELVAQVDARESALLQATIFETQRTRSVIDSTARKVLVPSITLGPWVIPKGYTVIVDAPMTHHQSSVYADPYRFNPHRFLGNTPDMYAWVPFGGGDRRCLGAAFANLEMMIVLRTILGRYRLETTSSPGEKQYNRGVAFTPRRGGLAIVHPRTVPAVRDHTRERA
ncbi:cytochrome P450 [Mycobacterium sp. BMJ-28]